MGFVKTEFGVRDRRFLCRGEMVVTVKDAITLHASCMHDLAGDLHIIMVIKT